MTTATTTASDALLREQGLGLVARLLADRTGAEATMVSVESPGGGLEHVRAGAGLDVALRDDSRFVRRIIESDGAQIERVPPKRSGGLAFIVAAPIHMSATVAGALSSGFGGQAELSLDGHRSGAWGIVEASGRACGVAAGLVG